MKILFFPPSEYRREKKLVGSLLAGWDFLPCVTVSVIAMSHFKDFMWADGWSATRERTVVKIPINEGQRNMTWTASGSYLPATQPVDWNCIPSALGHGSVLNVSAGILPSPRILADGRERTHPGDHPALAFFRRICNFRGENEGELPWNLLCYKIMPNGAGAWHTFGVRHVSFSTQLRGEAQRTFRRTHANKPFKDL